MFWCNYFTFMFIQVRPNCNLKKGATQGGTEQLLKRIDNNHACFDSVLIHEPNANGMTWAGKNSNKKFDGSNDLASCFAKFGVVSVASNECSQDCISCIFDSIFTCII